jgi:hypothetical protein
MSQLTSYQTGNDTDAAIGDAGGVEFRRAQSFQIPKRSIITSVELYLKNAASPPSDPITIRIETDNAGVPSGTLVDANATGTIAAGDIGGSYAFEVCTFSTAFILPKTTTFHIVASVPNQSTNVAFHWGSDFSSSSYANGTFSNSQNGGAWSNNTADGLFIVNGREVIPNPTINIV